MTGGLRRPLTINKPGIAAEIVGITDLIGTQIVVNAVQISTIVKDLQ